MIVMLRDFFFRTGPTSLRIEMLRILIYSAPMVIVFLIGGQSYWMALLVVIAFALGTASKYVCWHFRPPKPPSQPWTRYTKH